MSNMAGWLATWHHFLFGEIFWSFGNSSAVHTPKRGTDSFFLLEK
jgi:hypothetical protein